MGNELYLKFHFLLFWPLKDYLEWHVVQLCFCTTSKNRNFVGIPAGFWTLCVWDPKSWLGIWSIRTCYPCKRNPHLNSQCLKITEKVSFNIAFTFWVDKSWLKMPKMVHFGEFFKTWSLRSNSVTRQVSFNRTKSGEKCQNSNAKFWVIFKQCA